MSLTTVPPVWVRLFVITPIVFVVTLAVTLLSPVLHLVLFVTDLIDRKHWRFTRVGGLGIALCVTEFVGLVMALVLWLASGLGYAYRTPFFLRAHNRAFGWWLELMTRALRFYLGFDFTIPTTERVPGPIVTFARHAGPGDAFLLARTVIRDYHRQLRMLGTTKLLWDPFIDRLLTRMPYHFCDPNPADPTASLDAITQMCSSMDQDDVLIIFPEGGNWTPKRWTASIERLESRGLHDRAAQAAAMPNVLPPRTAGAAAALKARNDVSVVFVAHVGLEDLVSLREIWRKIPLRRHVAGTYWSFSPDQVPSDPIELSTWLFDQWAQVDQWIDEHRTAAMGPASDNG